MTYCGNLGTALGKPVVVNLSLGSATGPHDGTDAMNAAATQFGQAAGHAVALAAGNEGADNLHRSASLPASGTASFTLTVPSYSVDAAYYNDFSADLWLGQATSATISVRTPGGTTVTQTAEGDGEYATPDGDVYLYNFVDANGDRELYLYVYDQNVASTRAGTWTVTLTNATATADTYHVWGEDLYIGTTNTRITLQGADNNSSASNAATGRSSWAPPPTAGAGGASTAVTSRRATSTPASPSRTTVGRSSAAWGRAAMPAPCRTWRRRE